MEYKDHLDKINVFLSEVWQKDSKNYVVKNYPHLAALTNQAKKCSFSGLLSVIMTLEKEVEHMLETVQKLVDMQEQKVAYKFLTYEKVFLFLSHLVLKDITQQPLSLCDIKTVKIATQLSKIGRTEMYKHVAIVFMSEICTKLLNLPPFAEVSDSFVLIKKCGISRHSWKYDYAYLFQFSMYRYVDVCVYAMNNKQLFRKFLGIVKHVIKTAYPDDYHYVKMYKLSKLSNSGSLVQSEDCVHHTHIPGNLQYLLDPKDI